jgi:hypothetical protein
VRDGPGIPVLISDHMEVATPEPATGTAGLQATSYIKTKSPLDTTKVNLDTQSKAPQIKAQGPLLLVDDNPINLKVVLSSVEFKCLILA